MRTYSTPPVVGFLALSILGLCGLADAQQSYYFSMIIDGQGYIPNMIYSVNAANGQTRPSNSRLRNALAPFPGVTVRALSMGMDGTDYVDPHGLCIFGLESIGTAALSSPGVPNSAVASEPPSEIQSDLFGVRHAPSVAPQSPVINIKIVEENSAVLPVLADQYLALPSLGIPGTTTGSPTVNIAPDVVAFDYHFPPKSKSIYFAVSANITVQGNTYTPADILYLDHLNQIHRWRSATELQIDANDQIDALSLCLYPAPGVQPCCILSLRNGATTTLPSGHAVIGADLLLYTTQPPALSLWRDAASNGLQIFASAPLPEIDSVVSIDPKRFAPGSQYGYPTSAPTGVQFNDVSYIGGELHVGSQHSSWTTVVAPTTSIEWDFDLTPLPTGGSYVVPTPLEAGQQRLLTVHYIEEGYPKSHYEILGLPAQLPDTLDDFLVIQSPPSLVVLMTATVPCESTTPPWIIDLAGTPQVPVAPCAIQAYPLPGASAPYRVEAQAVDSFGSRSGAVSNIVWPSPGVASPTDLTIEKIDSGSVRVNWTPTLNTITEVAISGMPLATPLPLSSTGWQPPLVLNTGPAAGFRRIALTAVDGAGERSLPVQDSFYIGLEQKLLSNRSLPEGSTLSFVPGDLALEDSTATLITLARTPGPEFWTLDTLSHDMTTVTSHTLLSDEYTLGGVTSWFETMGVGNNARVDNHLIFAALHEDKAILVVTEPEAPYSIERIIDIALVTTPSSLGPMAVEVGSEQLLLVVDGRLHILPDLVGLMSFDVVDAKLVEPLREMEIAGVSCRKAGFYEITVNNGVPGLPHTHLLTLTSDHEIIGATELASPINAHGIVHAHDPLPTVYVSTDAGVEVFEMPRVVEVTPHDFGHRSRLFDLDNDGDVMDYDDLVLYSAAWQAWNADPQFTANWIEANTDPGAWDVHGGGLSFPGDGAITQGDFDALLETALDALAGILPPSVCVPTHPNWSNSASSCP